MAAFKGFYGTIKGKPCYVVNEGVTENGEAAYKIVLGICGGFSGWSGGAYRSVSYTGKKCWVKKSAVKRGKYRG